MVPLTGANRILVHFGLRELARGARVGIAALKSVAQIGAELSCGDVGFKLGPRVNAAGRLADASVGVRLLLSGDPAEARALAEELDRANAERQELQARIADEAVVKAQELGERRALVVSSEGWHVGVAGIVASRLVDRFHRPALVLCEEDGVAKGSGRSIEGFHLYEALARCSEHLTRFGGHRHAAGVTLPTSAVARLAESLEQIARERLEPEQLTPRLRIDAVLRPEEIDLRLAAQLRQLAPFGAGNPETSSCASGRRSTTGRRASATRRSARRSTRSHSAWAIGSSRAERGCGLLSRWDWTATSERSACSCGSRT